MFHLWFIRLPELQAQSVVAEACSDHLNAGLRPNAGIGNFQRALPTRNPVAELKIYRCLQSELPAEFSSAYGFVNDW